MNLILLSDTVVQFVMGRSSFGVHKFFEPTLVLEGSNKIVCRRRKLQAQIKNKGERKGKRRKRKRNGSNDNFAPYSFENTIIVSIGEPVYIHIGMYKYIEDQVICVLFQGRLALALYHKLSIIVIDECEKNAEKTKFN